MNEFLTKFGKKIKEYRKAMGLSQEKLAELVDLSTNTIVLLEHGRSFIKYKNLQKLCEVLQINEVDLFNFSMRKKKNSPKYNELIDKIKNLSLKQQAQIINIINTFE